MSKFNIGDIVRVVGYQENIDEMQKCLGEITTIANVCSHRTYEIKCDNQMFLWAEVWLEEAQEESETVNTDEFCKLLQEG